MLVPTPRARSAISDNTRATQVLVDEKGNLLHLEPPSRAQHLLEDPRERGDRFRGRTEMSVKKQGHLKEG
eukprot:g69870.t1